MFCQYEKIAKLFVPIFTIVLLVVIFPGTELRASECGMMRYLQERSSGVVIRNNQCHENAKISIGTEFELTSGARLWLKSLPQVNSDNYFQLICQNNSTSLVGLSVSSMFIPWINPKGLNNCSSWVDNKLSCEDLQGNKNQLFCVIASIKKPEFKVASKIERKTSVTMRNLDGIKVDKIIAAIEPEIELCRALYQDRRPINVSWKINTSAIATNVQIHQARQGNQQPLYECVKTVVSNFAYPKLTSSVTVVHTF